MQYYRQPPSQGRLNPQAHIDKIFIFKNLDTYATVKSKTIKLTHIFSKKHMWRRNESRHNCALTAERRLKHLKLYKSARTRLALIPPVCKHYRAQ